MQVDARCDFARRIVELVTDETCRTYRNLVRRFKVQRKERFLPVLDALVEIDVLIRDDAGNLSPGPVNLADVMEEFLAKLVEGEGRAGDVDPVDECPESVDQNQADPEDGGMEEMSPVDADPVDGAAEEPVANDGGPVIHREPRARQTSKKKTRTGLNKRTCVHIGCSS